MATEKKTPSAAALRAAAAQLEEKETGIGKPTVLWRLGSFILWALAAVAMYLPDIGKNWPFGACRMLFLGCQTECIIDIVVAGILCVLGALIWKAANHVHPVKSSNKLLQFIWNQFGVIMTGVILAPLAIIMIVKSDKIDQKLKKVVALVLALVFLGAGAASADYKPVTQDEVDEIVASSADEGYTGEAYWTKYGHSYHFDENCQSLQNTKAENLYNGTLEEAIAENRTDACDFCAGGAEQKDAA